MKRFTPRAGAFALAAILVALYSGTGLTGAVAQDQAELDQLETTQIQAAEEVQTAQDAQPRFVSNPVVQEIPGVNGEADADAPSRENAAASSLTELVQNVPLSGAMSEDMRCLAQAVYFESRGEPLAGQLAVARVVINRTESARFPNDYCSVVTQRAQFSFVRGGHIPQANERSDAWHRARAIAKIAHQDMWDSEAADSLYFHATYVSPRWARRMQAQARIDSHIFY